jgi:hypothetical protein
MEPSCRPNPAKPLAHAGGGVSLLYADAEIYADAAAMRQPVYLLFRLVCVCVCRCERLHPEHTVSDPDRV